MGRIGLEVVRHLILGGEGMWRARKRHTVEPVEPRRRKEPERVPSLTPGVADPLVGVEDDKAETSPGEVVTDRQAGLAATDDNGFDPLSIASRRSSEPPSVQRIALPSSYARRLVAAIGSSPYGTSPCCIAKTAAAARVDTPILLYAFWMWLSAVLTEIPNDSCHLLCLQPAREEADNLCFALCQPSGSLDSWGWLAGGLNDRPDGDSIEPSNTDLTCERLGSLLRGERRTVRSRFDLRLIRIRRGEQTC